MLKNKTAKLSLEQLRLNSFVTFDRGAVADMNGGNGGANTYAAPCDITELCAG